MANTKFLLTADRTLMSNYRNDEFLGFGTTAPPNIVPEWFFKLLFFPPIKTVNGTPTQAPYGLRKVETQLLNEVFEVLTVNPDNLPLSLGPASSTFVRILKNGRTHHKLFRRDTECMKQI